MDPKLQRGPTIPFIVGACRDPLSAEASPELRESDLRRLLAAWLLDHVELPADDLMFHGVANSATGELTQKPRIHSSFNFVEGRVCEECNTGWMSKLESTAKPILIPLVDNTRTVGSLSAEERGVVWKWVSKTAYLHTWTGP